MDSIPQSSGIPPIAFAIAVAVLVAAFVLVPYILWGMKFIYLFWAAILAFFFFGLGYRVGGGRLPL